MWTRILSREKELHPEEQIDLTIPKKFGYVFKWKREPSIPKTHKIFFI